MIVGQRLRWQILTSFVLLSSIVYLSSAILGLIFFSTSLTSVLDEELAVFASEVGHAIEIQNDRPHFRDWARIVETQPARSITTIQIFDAKGEMLDHYGPPGIKRLFLIDKEVRDNNLNMRIRTGPLKKDGVICGYLQIQLPTNGRDSAIHEYLVTTAFFTPVVLICLALISYFVSGKVAKPAQEMLRTLRSFVADASHELNTPLTIIQVQNDALARKLKKQEIEEKESEIITNTVTRMGSIVSNLMLLSEIEGSEHNKMQHKVLDLSALLNQTVETFNEKYVSKNLTLTKDIQPEIKVEGSSEELSHVISNLLENAFRYTPEGGTVALQAVSTNRQATITVSDTGIGIPEKSIPYIFDRFYRVDASRSRESGGVGLGLAIVKAMVQNHSGTIKVESNLGKGSRFVITLPLSRQE
ncbi:MAG TPA: HAMP domain-containing sensor histidine kinase [Drouetiella sp.]